MANQKEIRFSIYDPVVQAYREISFTKEQAEAYVQSAEAVKKQLSRYE